MSKKRTHPSSWHATLLLKLVWIVVLAANPAFSDTYSQNGVTSNFLFVDNNLWFTQGDRTLAVLDSETGNVLARKIVGNYGPELVEIEGNVLSSGYRGVIAFNTETFEVSWSGSGDHSVIVDDSLVYWTGNGQFACRHLPDGKLKWDYTLTGAWDLSVKKGRVFIFRDAELQPELEPCFVVLDLESGKEILRKTPEAGTYWTKAAFDGDWISVLSGPLKGKRENTKPDRILKWSTDGKEATVPISPEEIHQLEGTFVDLIQEEGQQSRSQYLRIRSVSEEGIHLKTTNLRIWKRPDSHQVLAASSERMAWSGFLPYLDSGARIEQIAEFSGKVFLGTNHGHVECIDLTTGQPKWMYVFPAIRNVTSYSWPEAPPLYLASQAKIFHQQNAEKKKTIGFVRIPDGLDPLTCNFGEVVSLQRNQSERIISDPQPANPFEGLVFLVILAWGFALSPFLIVSRAAWNRIKGTSTESVRMVGVGCLFISIFGWLIVGRVSMGSSVVIKLGFLLSLIVLVSGNRLFRPGKVAPTNS